ncbi:MAG: hypothetical protein ACD_20C00251G0007 [uncultured bacterium]|nr:MAG: hypothetical protein ACD_20C00251G0007 [uncultured bacterium]HBH18832.1 amino acid permease [Cyanobacteria bacterium UBA9579]
MIENQTIEQEIRLTIPQRIFKKKNPDELVDGANKTSFKKTLSAFDLIILGIGAVIGAGIFTLSGTAAAGSAGHVGAGPGLILSFIFAGFACALAGLCYAEFAAMIPVSGSAYTYTHATLGEIAAWLIGWALMLEYAIGNITVATGWSGYLMQFLGGFKGILPDWLTNPPYWLIYDYNTALLKYKELGIADPASQIPHLGPIPFSVNLPAILIIGLITAFLYRGIRESTKIASIMVAIKLTVILLFVAVGAFYVKPENWTPFLPNGFDGVFTGAFLVFFAFIGFDAISTAAEETKDPQKNIPIGIIASLGICTILYVAVAAVLTGMVPWNTIDTHAPVAAAMNSVGINWAAGLISIGAVTGLTSVLLVLQLGTTRILFAMSRDRLLPSLFSKIHSRYKTPHIITVIAGVLIALGTLFFDINEAAELCNIGTLSVFMIVCLGVIILRFTDPSRKRQFKVPTLPVSLTFSFLGIIIGTIAAGIFGLVMSKSIIYGALFGVAAGFLGKVWKIKIFNKFAELAIPIFGIITCFGLIKLGVPDKTLIMFTCWLTIGIIFYFVYGFRKSHQ